MADEAKKPISSVALEPSRRVALLSGGAAETQDLWDGLSDSDLWMVWLRPDGSILEASRSLARWLGREGELVGSSFFGWLEPAESSENERDELKSALDGLVRIRGVKLILRGRGGARAPVTVEGDLIAFRGEPALRCRLVRSETDISPFEEIPEIVWTASPEGRIESLNGRGKAFLQPRGALRQNDWLPLVHPDDMTEFLTHWRESLAKGEEFSLCFRLFHRRSGEYRWFLGRATPVRDETGRIERWRGTLCDVDAIKLAQLALEAADKRKDEFLATLSHELRSPLNVIMGYCQLFSILKPGTPEFNGAIEKIHRAARVQLQLISDLLDVSRIINGKMKLTIGPVNLSKLVGAAEESVRLSARTKNIHLSFAIATSIEWIEGEFVRLQQVLWNLLSNAVKFTPPDGTIELIVRDWAGGVEFLVRDSGEGISPEALDHVFDRFWQDGSKSKRRAGLGLGLAIVRHLTELHGGTVRAESEGKNKGATFIVRLPLSIPRDTGERTRARPRAAAPAPAKADEAPSFTLKTKPLEGVSVLVVDDEADSRDVLGNALRTAGAVVETAASARQALSVLERRPPALLFGDIGMPEMDGCEFMREWRAIEREKRMRPVPAVALSAFARKSDSTAALAAGYNCFLTKPVEIPNLIATAVGLVVRTDPRPDAS